MNNKKLGTDFENEACALLQQAGYWVHFITPDARGAQPFDIIAVKNGKPLAVECKTLAEGNKYFPLSRLEDNQILAFNRWCETGNPSPQIWVKRGEIIHVIKYSPVMVECKGGVKYNLDDATSCTRDLDFT